MPIPLEVKAQAMLQTRASSWAPMMIHSQLVERINAENQHASSAPPSLQTCPARLLRARPVQILTNESKETAGRVGPAEMMQQWREVICLVVWPGSWE